eukprot:6000711-Pyramimonas_sp.AAC.1
MPVCISIFERGVVSQVPRCLLGVIGSVAIPAVERLGGPLLPSWAVHVAAAILRSAAVAYRRFADRLSLVRARAAQWRSDVVWGAV